MRRYTDCCQSGHLCTNIGIYSGGLKVVLALGQVCSNTHLFLQNRIETRGRTPRTRQVLICVNVCAFSNVTHTKLESSRSHVTNHRDSSILFHPCLMFFCLSDTMFIQVPLETASLFRWFHGVFFVYPFRRLCFLPKRQGGHFCGRWAWHSR